MTRRKLSPLVNAPAHEVTDTTTLSYDPVQEEGVQFRVLTHNIRYATDTPFTGEEKWAVRCPRLCSELIFNSRNPATFICLQEVLHTQLWDILHTLNATGEKWTYIGVGRDDGIKAGEYSPILYRPDVWKLKKWDPIWLSPTPRVPSTGWDAASPRIATVGQFVHFESGQLVLVICTHLDDQGVEARANSAHILLTVLELEGDLGGSVVSILAGDFNSPPNDHAYRIMTAPDSFMTDVVDQVDPARRYGNELTYTGFSDEAPSSRIDYIFSKKRDLIKHEAYAVLPNRFDDGVFISDHRACVADFRISPHAR